MTALKDVCSQIRSKNAGPFWTTVDLFMPDTAAYDRVTAAEALRAPAIGSLYAVDSDSVRIFTLPDLRAVKISFPRPTGQGSLHDRDIHSGQQHVPLLNLDIP